MAQAAALAANRPALAAAGQTLALRRQERPEQMAPAMVARAATAQAVRVLAPAVRARVALVLPARSAAAAAAALVTLASAATAALAALVLFGRRHRTAQRQDRVGVEAEAALVTAQEAGTARLVGLTAAVVAAAVTRAAVPGTDQAETARKASSS